MGQENVLFINDYYLPNQMINTEYDLKCTICVLEAKLLIDLNYVTL